MSVELELDQVERVYPGPQEVHALCPTSLRIHSGDLISVVGRSGSGKSTFLNVLGLLDRPSAGRYLVRGTPTEALSERELTSLRAWQFGFIFQQYHLLSDRTAQENVELGLLYQSTMRTDRRARSLEALEQVGLSHRSQARPNEMSGGERQRVAIARVLCQHPRVLLCDEPTGNLDLRTSEAIVQLLMTINRSGLTVIIVTHDASIAELTPRRLLIQDGVVTDDFAGAS